MDQLHRDIEAISQSALNAYINDHVRQINRDCAGHAAEGYSLVHHTFRKWLSVRNRGQVILASGDFEYMVKYARLQASTRFQSWMFA
jgi:hypothetical protein